MVQSDRCCYVDFISDEACTVQQRSSGDPPAPQPELELLARAVSDETSIPLGRVRRILISAERLKPLMKTLTTTPASLGEADAPRTDSPCSDDPLRWYPIGANGRLRPPPLRGWEP